MEKSKQIIAKTRNIIVITVISIIILESNSFSFLRNFVSSYIIFFQGKRTLISNICLGILGSAILTFVCEHDEYKSTKRKLEGDILSVYRKWNKEMEPQTLERIEDIKYVNLIGEYMYPYWEEISLIYNTYLPYNRKNVYVKLIKTLYDYIKEFITYVEDEQYKKRNEEYFSRKLCELTKYKSMYPTDQKQSKLIDDAILLIQKQLRNLDKQKTSKDEKFLIDMINEKRCVLDEIAPQAEILDLLFYKNGAEQQDFVQDNKYIRSDIKKIRIKRRFSKINRFFRQIHQKCKFYLKCCKNFLKKS